MNNQRESNQKLSNAGMQYSGVPCYAGPSNMPDKDTNVLCIIPTGNVRYLALEVQSQDAPKKLQMEFRNYDGTHLQWKDVPTIYVSYNEFFGG